MAERQKTIKGDEAMPLSGEALYAQLGQLITEMPDLMKHEWQTPAGRIWMGRAGALLEETGNHLDAATFKAAVQRLTTNPYQLGHEIAVHLMTTTLYHALAVAELKAPAGAQNGYIPVGEQFTALAAVGRVLGEAGSQLMIVDPYADANLLTEYASQAADGINIQVMTDTKTHKPGLSPAMHAWKAQYKGTRPLEIRLSPSGTLHDRMIIVDGLKVWTVGQSLNALGKRSPTALVHVNEETAQLKIQAYRQLWASATPLL